MAGKLDSTGRKSVDNESTFRDIWQVSQRPGARFDPQSSDQELDYRKRLRKNIGTEDRYSFENISSPQVRKPEISKQMQRRSTTLNLEKSLQLLDDAVGTPSVLRTTKHRTSISLTHSTYKAKELPSGSMFDVSASIGLTPGKSLLNTPGHSKITFGETGMETSLGVDASSSVFKNLADTIDDDVTTTNVALLLEENPALAACTTMFTDFMQAMKNNRSEHQVFQLLADYERICQDNTSLLKKLVKRTKPGQSKLAKTCEMLEAVRQERNTWRLLTSLYRDRLETEMKSEEEPMMVDSLGKHNSERDVIESLYEKDATIRQHQLVVDWLEKNSEDSLEDVYDQVDFFTDNTGAWENTLHHLRERRSGGVVHSDRPMVDNLDPDAVVRQGRPLQDLDRSDESRLLRYLFGLIRAGQIDKAQQLCVKVGQSWRAATLEGWRPYHDPNFDQTHSTEREKVQGNPHRDIWKKTCWTLSEDDRLDIHERGIYGAYSGNLKQLLPVCNKWEDQLWAFFRCCVDRRVEQEVRMTHNLSRPWEELPKTYVDKMLSAEAIFQEIQASSNEDVKKQGKQRFQTIQKYIILGDVDTLIEEMYEWCRDDVHRPSQHLVRFMCHVILFFRAIGLISKEELCVAILETYVKTLIEGKQQETVATYTATLPKKLQIGCYAKFLEGIKVMEERKHCLMLGEEASLDMNAITQHVVENVRRRDTTDANMETEMQLEANISPEDREKIDALDWLVFNDSQRAEAIKQTNALIREYLVRCMLSAAREAFHKLPPDSIDLVFQNWQKQTGSDELNGGDANTVREYLCVQAYLDAHDSFNDWFKHYHNSKPVQPEVPLGNNFTEKVAYEHKMREFEQELERWQHSLDLQSKTTSEKIYNVLLFVDGGWMVDQRQDVHRDESRTHQMRLLRQLCLPPLCFLLHTVLHTTKQYRSCMQLATIIASDHYQLYKVFRRDELQKLLHKLRETSITMLDMGLDPLGFELS